jgi:hypothetical protein
VGNRQRLDPHKYPLTSKNGLPIVQSSEAIVVSQRGEEPGSKRRINDNHASIKKTFEKTGGERVFDPGQLFVALDHNAPPSSARLANDHHVIRVFVKKQGIARFAASGQASAAGGDQNRVKSREEGDPC